MKYEQLHVRHVSFDQITFNSKTSYRKFDIMVGEGHILRLLKVIIGWKAGGNGEMRWCLLQTSEVNMDGSAEITNCLERNDDYDILVRGHNHHDNTNFTRTGRTDFDFGKGLYVLRAPTLEVLTTINAGVDVWASIYYNVIVASVQDVTTLLKQFYGRKQYVLPP